MCSQFRVCVLRTSIFRKSLVLFVVKYLNYHNDYGSIQSKIQSYKYQEDIFRYYERREMQLLQKSHLELGAINKCGLPLTHLAAFLQLQKHDFGIYAFVFCPTKELRVCAQAV